MTILPTITGAIFSREKQGYCYVRLSEDVETSLAINGDSLFIPPNICPLK